MTTPPLHIALIGCGKMGGALLNSWLDQVPLPAEYLVVDPYATEINAPNVSVVQTADEALQKSDVVILAVKPQVMAGICANLKPFIREDALVISIAAGLSLDDYAGFFGVQQPVIRVMPNTPAAIGQGVSVVVAGAHAAEPHKEIARALLTCAGVVEWLPDETLMNAVTALSGSGPAYLFYLIEMLAQSGQRLGLDEEMAMRLARQTVIGSAALAADMDEVPAATLRENVTSPGGTTAAALQVLMDGRAQDIFDAALKANTIRSEELQGE